MGITDFNVQCDTCNNIVQPEAPTNQLKYGIAVAAVFALFFGIGVGGTIGIATAGLGIAATLPLGILGAYFGLKLGRWVAGRQDGITCPECGDEFTT